GGELRGPAAQQVLVGHGELREQILRIRRVLADLGQLRGRRGLYLVRTNHEVPADDLLVDELIEDLAGQDAVGEGQVERPRTPRAHYGGIAGLDGRGVVLVGHDGVEFADHGGLSDPVPVDGGSHRGGALAGAQPETAGHNKGHTEGATGATETRG